MLNMENSSVFDYSDQMNSSNETNFDYPLEHPADDFAAVVPIVVPVIFAILMAIGVVGNGTLIYTVIANKSMRNVPNVLIVSLSCGDLMLLLMSAPFSATYFTTKNYPFGQYVCKSNEFLQTLSVGVSVFTLTALSGDRYVAIVHPMSKHKGKPTFKIIVTVAVIWTLSAIFAIPDAISHSIAQAPDGVHYCSPYPQEWEWYPKAHTMFRFIILFIIPLLIIGCFYILMARILVQSSRQMPCESTLSPGMNQQQQRQIEARMKVAKVVLSFVILFIVCWLPRHVYLIWYHWFPDADFSMGWVVLKIVAYCLTYIYACVNPFALYFLSSQFRKYYDRYLFRCCPKSYRPIRPESNSAMLFNSTMRRGSTSMTVVKSNSEL